MEGTNLPILPLAQFPPGKGAPHSQVIGSSLVSRATTLCTEPTLTTSPSLVSDTQNLDFSGSTVILVGSWRSSSLTLGAMECSITTASRPTKVYGWKFTHHGWISNHYLENQPLVGKPTTLWLEILPSQPHRYHNSALYNILFDKGKVEENSTSWNRPLKDGEWGGLMMAVMKKGISCLFSYDFTFPLPWKAAINKVKYLWIWWYCNNGK